MANPVFICCFVSTATLMSRDGGTGEASASPTVGIVKRGPIGGTISRDLP